MARNHALRIRAASARFDELPDDPPSAADADADAVGDALAHLLARERGDALLAALATLGAEHREVVALIEFEEFSMPTRLPLSAAPWVPSVRG